MKRFKVLMIEDNPGDILLTTEALKESKFVVDIEVATNGKEGVDFLFQRGNFQNSTRPDLVLLDINLPLKSGHEVLQEIKANPSTREIPVIMLTTSSTQDDILTSYQEQASCYIVKPSESDQYLEFIQVFERFCSTLTD
ncbi:response regulator [Algoriphagus boritolerans]|uniref:CheY chemotaxis protein or a CheY-like REC (Receiver) domain n=1 Tax=Algoriphagus boritolerans DSM 17298 = JCM 18970 TaxID=1120964 RepID=A0A1H5XDD2_9BACT|nr:response regulator [Algoriphagus boritolerans]SEG09465.1 CheY chemotaxis protein or a CheY-like REC (receiver) domain [Algoriphagus boritolerans DSM 17298 = JCM 18970]